MTSGVDIEPAADAEHEIVAAVFAQIVLGLLNDEITPACDDLAIRGEPTRMVDVPRADYEGILRKVGW